ncbi:hypothetical protein IQ238_21135 [Pleurocapsales cyanobacterium LEGE 06147]|nr:hypothetical protein [Pleurocapsales cyanobacterium LEGE 06147]
MHAFGKTKLGHNAPTARQGYYIQTESAEEAWQKMAIRYPEETEAGFTVQEWELIENVIVVEVKQDENGNTIEVDQNGNIVKTDENGNVIR